MDLVKFFYKSDPVDFPLKGERCQVFVPLGVGRVHAERMSQQHIHLRLANERWALGHPLLLITNCTTAIFG